nr:neuroparsin-A-like isoform X2 [Cherax quadricarinatus]
MSYTASAVSTGNEHQHCLCCLPVQLILKGTLGDGLHCVVTSTTASTTQTSITSITPTYTTRITLTTTTATTMRPSSFLTTSIVVLVVVVLQETAAAPRCNRQGTRTPSLNCKYGTVADWCGNRVCAKGPGETCGGDWGEKGACVAGTYCSCGFCSCGYCTGCAANLDCWFGHFC